MPQLTNPYTGKPVSVPDAHADRLVAAGFKPVQPVAEKSDDKPASTPRRGRPRKSS